MQVLQLLSLTILMVTSNVVDALRKSNKETMLMAESNDGNRYTITRYTSDGRDAHTNEQNLLNMFRGKSSITSLPIASPLSSSSSSVPYYRRPLNYVKDNTKDVYKKAASDYWEQEMPASYGHGEGGASINEDVYGGNNMDGGEYGGGHGGYIQEGHGGYHRGKEISITPDHKPITLHYRTHSQPIIVHQTRIPGECQFKLI